MNDKALLGLVKSRLAYLRDWPECVAKLSDGDDYASERVFDISALLTDPTRKVEIEWGTCGRNLPFPMFAVVGSGEGICIVAGGEDGLYCYAYSAPVPMIYIEFTATGWKPLGIIRRSKDEIEYADRERINELSDGLGLMLTLIAQACDNTRHVVSYRLTRAERRRAMKAGASLDAVTVHHVCLNGKARDALTERRGASVVATPKRLHEVRSHWRRLASGNVVRVRHHRRGNRGDSVLPRIYTARTA